MSSVNRGGSALLVFVALFACSDSPTAPSEPVVERQPTQIAFTSARDGNSEIYTMDPTGTDAVGAVPARRLTNNAGVDAGPDFSPDGLRIVFHSVRAGHTNTELYVMSVDGSNQTRLTNSSESSTFAAWSPDGSRIAFARGTSPTATTRGTRQIWVMNADGTGAQQVTAEGDNYRPRWSPDSKKLIFASDRDGDFTNALAREKGPTFGLHDIYLMNADGTGLQRLTSIRTSLSGEPVFSPNGKQIAFRSRRDKDANGDNYCAIWVMNTDGSNPRNLTPIPADITWDKWCNAYPVWSTDGQHVVFHGMRPTTDFGVQLEIYSVDVGTSVVQRLTFNAATEQFPAIR
jgi:Tol biopolymer transport system component